LEEKYIKILDEATGELEGYNKTLNAQAKAEEKAKSAASKSLEVIDDSVIALRKRNEALDEYLTKLGEISKQDLDVEATILERQKEIIENQKNFLETLVDETKPEAQAFLEQYRELFFGIVPNKDEEAEIQDNFYDFFNRIRQGLISGTIPSIQGNYNSFVEAIIGSMSQLEGFDVEGFRKKLESIPEGLQKGLVEYFSALQDRYFTILGLIGMERVRNLGNTSELLKLETEIAKSRANQVKEGRTNYQQSQLELGLIDKRLGLDKERVELSEKILEDTKILRDPKASDKAKKDAELRIAEYEKLIENLNKITEGIRDNISNNADFLIGVEKTNIQYKEQGKIIEENKKKQEEFFDPQKLFDYFSGLENGLDLVLDDLNTNLDQYLERFGYEGVDAILRGISTGVDGLEFQTREQVQQYITLLENVGNKIAAALTGGQNPFQPLIDQLKGVVRALPKEVSGIQKFLNEAIIDGLSRKDIADEILGAYSDISGRLSNIITANNSLVLESLAYQQAAALAEIGEANTENEKQNKRIQEEREKVEKDFAKRRFEVEKKARITELKFSIGQALADAAQATLNALANIPAPFGAVYAAGLAGLTAFQVKQIQSQLTFAQSQQFVGRRGGAVMGGSHEQGGVPALLEGGEFILNKEAVGAFSNQIQSINNATGGRPMAIDDSRLVQAIASQNLDKKQPLKTYVLYQDIKDTEKLNTKISQLSKL